MNVFLGPNGVGKTNLLEAVYFLGTGQSPRAARLGDIIRFGQRQAYLKAQVYDQTNEIDIEWLIDRQSGRAARRNGLSVQRMQDIVGLLPVVYFSPDQIDLIKGSPNGRRKHVDDVLRQLFPTYGDDLAKYQQALRQRNEALRLVQQKKTSREYLTYWDEPLRQHGLRLIEKRKRFVADISDYLRQFHQQLTNADDSLTMVYDQAGAPDGEAIDDERTWHAASERSLAEEIQRGYTLIGPHRDDIVFYLHGRAARQFASQGQQRSIVLSLLLAELELIRDVRRQQPLLLLDDVFSELDEQRRNKLIRLIPPAQQTFITATDWSSITRLNPPENVTFYTVGDGNVRLG